MIHSERKNERFIKEGFFVINFVLVQSFGIRIDRNLIGQYRLNETVSQQIQ